MITTVNKSQFIDAFYNMGRKDNFSYEGLGVLYDYFDEYEDSTGEKVELDVIAFCCEYSENDVDYIVKNYNIDIVDADGDEDKISSIVEDYLQYNTQVCGRVAGGFVYADF